MNQSEGIFKKSGSIFSALNDTTNTIYNIIRILGYLSVAGFIIGFFQKISLMVIVSTIVFIVALIIIIVLYFIARKLTSMLGPDLVKRKSDYKILLKEILYEYFPDRQTMRQRKHYKLQILRDGVESFTDRYRWTGKGKCIVKSLNLDYKIVNERQEEIWNYYDVYFPCPSKKNEPVDFVIEWELFDEEKSALPFLSTMIDCPTEHLIMQVILPKNLANKQSYLCSEYRNYIDRGPIKKCEQRWDEVTQIIKFEIDKPKLYHKFKIDFR
jgi:hypothetical protein